uniref:Transmembrane protein n=1 Tax=Triticum urartu TaxID=4572 RepID=A0A8R7VF45_TRIUA
MAFPWRSLPELPVVLFSSCEGRTSTMAFPWRSFPEVPVVLFTPKEGRTSFLLFFLSVTSFSTFVSSPAALLRLLKFKKGGSAPSSPSSPLGRFSSGRGQGMSMSCSRTSCLQTSSLGLILLLLHCFVL